MSGILDAFKLDGKVALVTGSERGLGRGMAVALAQAARKLAGYGIDLRQLRVLQQAAGMEAAIVEQAIEPYRRRSGVPQDIVVDLYRVVMQAHAALLHGQIH